MDATELINWSKISKLLSGSPRALNSNRIPIKHQIAINELKEIVNKWIDKHKK